MRPQDIEGCYDAAGQAWFLQARPIAIDYQRLSVWTNANVTESFPGVTTALTYSMSRMFYRVIFYDCYRRLGYDLRALHDAHDAHLDRMIGFIEGRVYYNLNAFYHLHSLSPLFPLFRAHWESMMGFRSSYRPQAEHAIERLRRAAAFAWGAARISLLASRHAHDMRRFYAFWEQLFEPLRGARFEGRDALSLVREYRRVWRAVGNEWGVTLLNDTYLPVLYGWLEALFAGGELARDRTLLSDLLCGDESLRSVDIMLSVVQLAEQVRASHALRARFLTDSAEQLWEAVQAEQLEPAFCAALRLHLARHGDRGLMELKMEQPSLRDAPEQLLRSLKDYAQGELTVAGIREREQAVRAQAEQRLQALLRAAPLQRWAARGLLWLVRGLIRQRENSRYCRSELFGFSKAVFRALGGELARRGVLERAQDVFHLTQDELFGYLDGTGVQEDLRALVALRHKEYAAHQRVETPVELTTLGPVRDNQLHLVARAELDGATLRGIGSSAGRVRGRARVILDPNAPAAARRLEPDTILVARETDPGWLFLMLAARAIVVERGSMLSHTAITGRKFGIPTVVSVADATRRIAEGALIEVDGASGTVTVLEAPAAVAAQPELCA